MYFIYFYRIILGNFNIAGNSKSTNRESRAAKRGMKKLIQDIECPSTANELQESPNEEPRVITMEEVQEELQQVKAERDALLAEKREWEIERSILREQIDKTSVAVKDVVRSNLIKYFSPSQVDFLLTGIPVKHWCEDDISRALTLRYLSPKAYRYLRNTVQFPYPSISTLHRWISKINVEPGILTSVLKLLQHKATTMIEWDRLCVMSFDEMSVAYEWTYDKGTDTLYSPKSKVQCVMIRGLIGSWKQIVYYNFDLKMSKDSLLGLIMKIESTGFHVVAMVSDLDASNIKLHKALSVDIDNPSFTNPF